LFFVYEWGMVVSLQRGLVEGLGRANLKSNRKKDGFTLNFKELENSLVLGCL
jgi:hypothetical protein